VRDIVVTVQDRGVGISSGSLRFITDPFFTTRQDSGGVGLGLAIASGIVEEHGGRMTFDSEPGKGTTARVYLPAGPVNDTLKGKAE
jgi:signal transduction histidine kinase